MPLTKYSKVKEALRNPVGHDLLHSLARRTGRSERWLDNPLVAGMSLHALDRIAGAGFSDLLVEMAAHAPDALARPDAEHKAWWKEAVFYQIFPPSFMDSDHDGMGDLGGVVQRLPYLCELGVTALCLWPLLDEADCGHGQRSFTALREDLGTDEDFELLVRQAHARGLRVVIGLDVSCTSDEHPWFEQALAGEKTGSYVLRPGTADAPPNNWARGGVPVWSWRPQIASWGLNLAGPGKPDLNWDSAALRADMQQVLRHWLDKGVDGFALGPVNTLSRSDLEDGSPAMASATGQAGYEKYAYGPRLHRFLRELRAAAPAPAMLAGEARGVGTEMAKLFTQSDRGELDMVFDRSHLTPRGRARSEDGRLDLADLKKYYLRWMDRYAGDHWMALFLEGPESPRIVSRLGAAGLYRAILAKLLNCWLLTLRGSPFIYQGGELGLANTRFNSAEELRDFSSLQRYTELREQMGEREALQKVLCAAADHARTPMPWSAGDKAGFTGAVPWMRLSDNTDHLNVNAQMQDAASVWNFTRKLIALRKASPALVYGSFNPVFAKNKKVFCYFRILESEKWYVEMNLCEKEVVRPGRILLSQKLELSNYDTPSRSLRPYEANLYRCE